MTDKKNKPNLKTTKLNLDSEVQNLVKIRKEFHEILNKIKGSGLTEFISYLHSPWRIMWSNFLAGVAKGLGIIVGMTLVFGALIWMLTYMVDFPLIGEYAQEVINELRKFNEQTQ